MNPFLSLIVFILAWELGAAEPPTEPIIDLQFAICDRDKTPTEMKLGLQSNPKIQLVTYYDSPDFYFATTGLFFKTKKGKHTLKSEITLISESQKPNSRCEIDRYGSRRTLKCSIEKTASEDDLWSASQKTFVEQNYREKINWDRLVTYGPYRQKKWKFSFEEHPAALEVLVTPNGRRVTELSIKIPNNQEDLVYSSAIHYLKRLNVQLCKTQKGKLHRLFRLPEVLTLQRPS